MPGIDQILETILSTARQESEATLSEARDRCERIRKEAEADVAALKENMEKTTRTRCAEIEGRAETQARLNRRRTQLAVKQELIDGVFARSLGALCALSDDDFSSFITGLMTQAAATGRERVLTAPGDKRINAGLIEKVNGALAAKGLPGQLTLAGETTDIRGGFVLEENGVLTNCSFEMLLRQLRSSVEADVARVLFSGGEG